MPRRPHPAATTSTLKPNPELAGDETPSDGPTEEEAAEAAVEAGPAEEPPDEASQERQLSHPATAATLGVGAAVMASHPPPLEDSQPRRRPGRPRGTGRAAAPTPAIMPAIAALAALVDVQLSDAELQDLGAFTRLALKIGAGGNLDGFAAELEAMLSAYRRAQL